MKKTRMGCVALALALGASALDGAEMPAAAKQAVAKMEAAVAQAKKKAVAELTSVMSLESRMGRVESAAAINEKIAELAAELGGNAGESKRGTDFLPGVWRMQSGILFTMEKGNRFSAAGGNFKWSGSWRVENNKLLVDSTAFVDTYDLPPRKEAREGRDVLTLRGKNSKGEAIYFEKQE